MTYHTNIWLFELSFTSSYLDSAMVVNSIFHSRNPWHTYQSVWTNVATDKKSDQPISTQVLWQDTLQLYIYIDI